MEMDKESITDEQINTIKLFFEDSNLYGTITSESKGFLRCLYWIEHRNIPVSEINDSNAEFIQFVNDFTKEVVCFFREQMGDYKLANSIRTVGNRAFVFANKINDTKVYSLEDRNRIFIPLVLELTGMSNGNWKVDLLTMIYNPNSMD
jgi:hypothetical protein